MVWVYLKEKPNAELIGRMNGNPVSFEHWTFEQKFLLWILDKNIDRNILSLPQILLGL